VMISLIYPCLRGTNDG